MPEYYPQLIMPLDLEKISRLSPPVPTIDEPTKPKLVEPQIPSKPSEPLSFSQAWGCGLLILGIFILIVYVATNSDQAGKVIKQVASKLFPLSLLFIVAPFVAIYIIYSYHKDSSSVNEEYRKKMEIYLRQCKQYEIEIESYKQQYEQNLGLYEQIIYPKYLADKKKIEVDKSMILSIDNTLNYRREKVIEYFANSQHPTAVVNPYLTGVTEESYFKFLRTKSNNFFKNYSIVYDDSSTRYYVPDIVYFDSNIGILIDIEIDEPYLGSDGTPIHYVGYDDKRNNFFTENGWIVIRFAEEQVVEYQSRCYDYIQSVIESIVSGKFSVIQGTLPQVSRWTKDEAHKMAFSRKRNTYLGQTLVERMTQERVIEEIDDTEDPQDDLPF